MLDIRIQNGLLELLKQKPLNDITTKDIIESAETSRKTFYTYYKDKRDLLMEIKGAIITDLQEVPKEDRKCLTRTAPFQTRKKSSASPRNPLPTPSRFVAITGKSAGSCCPQTATLTCSPGSSGSLTRSSCTGASFCFTSIASTPLLMFTRHRSRLTTYLKSTPGLWPTSLSTGYVPMTGSQLAPCVRSWGTPKPTPWWNWSTWLTSTSKPTPINQATTSTPNRKKSGQSPLPLLKHVGFGCWPLFFCLSFATTTKGWEQWAFSAFSAWYHTL